MGAGKLETQAGADACLEAEFLPLQEKGQVFVLKAFN